MRKLISGLCAILISVGTLGTTGPASAMPVAIQQPVETVSTQNPNLQTVRHRDRWERRHHRYDRRWDRRHHRYDRRWDRRHHRWDRRWDRRYHHRWDRGRYYRPGIYFSL
jgi:hypothetical protein